MIPEPTPVSGSSPLKSGVSPSVVMVTTAGLTASAASVMAEFSSTVTFWTGGEAPVVWMVGCWVTVVTRSRRPVVSSATYMPPAARTADNSATTSIESTPAPRRPRRGGGAGTYAGGGGSNQCWGVCGGCHWLVCQRGRSTGGGVEVGVVWSP